MLRYGAHAARNASATHNATITWSKNRPGVQQRTDGSNQTGHGGCILDDRCANDGAESEGGTAARFSDIAGNASARYSSAGYGGSGYDGLERSGAGHTGATRGGTGGGGALEHSDSWRKQPFRFYGGLPEQHVAARALSEVCTIVDYQKQRLCAVNAVNNLLQMRVVDFSFGNLEQAVVLHPSGGVRLNAAFVLAQAANNAQMAAGAMSRCTDCRTPVTFLRCFQCTRATMDAAATAPLDLVPGETVLTGSSDPDHARPGVEEAEAVLESPLIEAVRCATVQTAVSMPTGPTFPSVDPVAVPKTDTVSTVPNANCVPSAAPGATPACILCPVAPSVTRGATTSAALGPIPDTPGRAGAAAAAETGPDGAPGVPPAHRGTDFATTAVDEVEFDPTTLACLADETGFVSAEGLECILRALGLRHACRPVQQPGQAFSRRQLTSGVVDAYEHAGFIGFITFARWNHYVVFRRSNGNYVHIDGMQNGPSTLVNLGIYSRAEMLAWCDVNCCHVEAGIRRSGFAWAVSQSELPVADAVQEPAVVAAHAALHSALPPASNAARSTAGAMHQWPAATVTARRSHWVGRQGGHMAGGWGIPHGYGVGESDGGYRDSGYHGGYGDGYDDGDEYDDGYDDGCGDGGGYDDDVVADEPARRRLLLRQRWGGFHAAGTGKQSFCPASSAGARLYQSFGAQTAPQGCSPARARMTGGDACRTAAQSLLHVGARSAAALGAAAALAAATRGERRTSATVPTAKRKTATYDRDAQQLGAAWLARSAWCGGDDKRQRHAPAAAAASLRRGGSVESGATAVQPRGADGDGSGSAAGASSGGASAEPEQAASAVIKATALWRALLAVDQYITSGRGVRSTDVADWLERDLLSAPSPIWVSRNGMVKYIRRQLQSMCQKGKAVVWQDNNDQGSDEHFMFTDSGRKQVERNLRAASGGAGGGKATGGAGGGEKDK